jgi:hypothetical protein
VHYIFTSKTNRNVGCQCEEQLTEMATVNVDSLSAPHTKTASLHLLEYVSLIFTDWQLCHKFVTKTNPQSLISVHAGNCHLNFHMQYNTPKPNLGGSPFHVYLPMLESVT